MNRLSQKICVCVAGFGHKDHENWKASSSYLKKLVSVKNCEIVKAKNIKQICSENQWKKCRVEAYDVYNLDSRIEKNYLSWQ